MQGAGCRRDGSNVKSCMCRVITSLPWSVAVRREVQGPLVVVVLHRCVCKLMIHVL